MSTSNQSGYEKNIFRGDQHTAIISQKLRKFYEDNQFFDTVIITGSDCISIRAHSIVLSAFSEYFLDIYSDSLPSPNANVIKLKEIEASALKSIIDFMYFGWIELSLENVVCLLRTAFVIKMHDLVNGCSEFIAEHFTNNNCLSSFRLANEIGLSGLREKSLNFTFNNFEEVSKSKELLQLNEIELKNLLFDENPFENIQDLVFLSLVAWIEYDKINRQNLSFKLLSNIHYQHLTPKFILQNRKSICKTVECSELICSWLQWHLSQKTGLIEQQNCKLAVVTGLCEGLSIQTYQPRMDLWAEKILKIHFKYNPDSSKILINGKLIIVTEFIDNSQKCIVECLYLNTCKVERLPSMHKGRKSSQLANLDGHLCVFGGTVSNNYYIGPIDIFNFQKREWVYVVPPYTPSMYSKIVAHKGVLYIVDLNYGLLQCYHLQSYTWTSKAIPTDDLFGFGCAAVGDFLYVIGGYNFRQGKCVNTVKRYTISNNSWCKVAPLPKDIILQIKTTVTENRIVICGGNGLLVNFVAEYNPATDTWKTLSQLSAKTPNHHSIICTLRS